MSMFFNWLSSSSMILATIDFSITVTSTVLQLKFVFVTSFGPLLGRLCELPHSENQLLNSINELQTLRAFTS